MFRRGDEVCTSRSFNFHAWYRIEIRFSENPRQKDKIGDIIWRRRKKCVVYRLDIFFSITHSFGPANDVKDQLVLPEGYSLISLEEYRKKDTKLHTMSGS